MKRFTATEKWEKEWFQDLTPKLKCLWIFLCDHVDSTGVWEPNFKLASFQIGERVEAADLSAFGEKVMKLENGKFFLISFIEFQYGRLSETCPAHKPVFRTLAKNRVSSRVLDSLFNRLPDTDTEKEEDKKGSEEGKKSSDEVAIPTAEEVAIFGNGATPTIPDDYCRYQHAKHSEDFRWITPHGRLIDWRAKFRRYWSQDRDTWKKGVTRNGNGRRGVNVNHPDHNPL